MVGGNKLLKSNKKFIYISIESIKKVAEKFWSLCGEQMFIKVLSKIKPFYDDSFSFWFFKSEIWTFLVLELSRFWTLILIWSKKKVAEKGSSLCGEQMFIKVLSKIKPFYDDSFSFWFFKSEIWTFLVLELSRFWTLILIWSKKKVAEKCSTLWGLSYRQLWKAVYWVMAIIILWYGFVVSWCVKCKRVLFF